MPTLPEAVILPDGKAMPLVTSSEPAKELEPVLVPVRMPASVRVLEILAVPPTSNMVSVFAPALIPSNEVAEVNSNEPEPEALTKEKRPVWVVAPVTASVPPMVVLPPTEA